MRRASGLKPFRIFFRGKPRGITKQNSISFFHLNVIVLSSRLTIFANNCFPILKGDTLVSYNFLSPFFVCVCKPEIKCYTNVVAHIWPALIIFRSSISFNLGRKYLYFGGFGPSSCFCCFSYEKTANQKMYSSDFFSLLVHRNELIIAAVWRNKYRNEKVRYVNCFFFTFRLA